MNISLKSKWLLGLLVGLALLKFVIVPLLVWQEDKAINIGLLKDKISKGQNLLSNQQDLELSLAELQQVEQELYKNILSQDNSETAFQLRTQKAIDILLAKYDLSVRNSNWLSPIDNGAVLEHRLELNLRGAVKDFALLTLEIEQQLPKINTIEVSGLLSNMRPAAMKLGNFNGKLIVSAWQAKGGMQ